MEKKEGMVLDPSAAESNLANTTSPPRSSDSDWSDIDTGDENNLTDDDEDVADKLAIDTGEVASFERDDNGKGMTESQTDKKVDSETEETSRSNKKSIDYSSRAKLKR